MDSVEETIKNYFAAWDAHDPKAVLSLFNPDGSYHDSATQEALRGPAIADYAQALFTAFPDLRLEMLPISRASTGVYAAPWILFGTHQGELMGHQATGKKVVLTGCDFIRLSQGKLDSVRGFFDVKALFGQLGLAES